jgi:hypothetical protein
MSPRQPCAIFASLRLHYVPIEHAAVGLWVDIEVLDEGCGIRSRGLLEIVPYRSHSVVVLKNDVGSSISVHIAYTDNVPSGPGILHDIELTYNRRRSLIERNARDELTRLTHRLERLRFRAEPEGDPT